MTIARKLLEMNRNNLRTKLLARTYVHSSPS